MVISDISVKIKKHRLTFPLRKASGVNLKGRTLLGLGVKNQKILTIV